MPKVMSTTELIAVNKAAVKKNYDRVVTDDLIDQLDHEGLHVVVRHYDQGDAVRCQVWCKLEDSLDPEIIWLDIPIGTFKRLDDAADVIEVTP